MSHPQTQLSSHGLDTLSLTLSAARCAFRAMVAGWDVSLEESMRGMLPKMARSIAGKKLPPVPAGLAGVKDEKGKPPTSIMLFYQYVEPAWTAKQHRRALSFVDVSACSYCECKQCRELVHASRSGARAWPQARPHSQHFAGCTSSIVTLALVRRCLLMKGCLEVYWAFPMLQGVTGRGRCSAEGLNLAGQFAAMSSLV